MEKVDINGLEKKLLDLMQEYDTDYLDNDLINQVLSPYEILILICFINGMKSLKFDEIRHTKMEYHYDNKTYIIPEIKILRKENN